RHGNTRGAKNGDVVVRAVHIAGFRLEPHHAIELTCMRSIDLVADAVAHPLDRINAATKLSFYDLFDLSMMLVLHSSRILTSFFCSATYDTFSALAPNLS